MTTKKTVIFPIEVPQGDLCWDKKSGVICSHFDNFECLANCSLGFYNKYQPSTGNVFKDKKCAELRELK
jgi:hypothetical protein